MTTLDCPACGHTFTPASSGAHAGPDSSVVRWYRNDNSWMGEASTEEIYSTYLRATDGTPVSRQRFVADLAYLGVEQVLDDETYLLLRP